MSEKKDQLSDNLSEPDKGKRKYTCQRETGKDGRASTAKATWEATRSNVEEGTRRAKRREVFKRMEPSDDSRRGNCILNPALPYAYLRGTDSFAKLAGDAPLFPRRITPQSVLSAEARAERSLFERVVDGYAGLHENLVGRGRYRI